MAKPGDHYILPPVYFFFFFFLFQSRISETAGDSTNNLSQQVVWGAGLEFISDSQNFVMGGARVKKGPKIPQT